MSKTGHPDLPIDADMAASARPTADCVARHATLDPETLMPATSCATCALPADAFATCENPACPNKAHPLEELAARADFTITEGEPVPRDTQEPAAVHIAGPAKPDGGGMRFNAGKNQLELIPVEWIWGLGMVLTRGAAKYAVRNWERGMAWSYPIGCALRHIMKFACGERYDPETGCHHLYMAAWNCCALATYDIRGIGENDLGAARLEWIDAVSTTPGPELLAIIEKKTKEQEAAMKAKAAAS